MKASGWKTVFFAGAACAMVVVLLLSLPALVGTVAGQATSAPDLSARKSLGSPKAPITIDVFADFQCPQCKIFFLTTTQLLIDNYVSSGKVYLVHHDFPLSMHSNSRQAAQWANAAALAGKFEAAERALYEKQDTWAATGQIEQVLAAALSPADMKKVRDLAKSQAVQIEAAIQKDLALGNTRNVSGTPTVFVTHRGNSTTLPQGGVNYPLLKGYLDYLLTH